MLALTIFERAIGRPLTATLYRERKRVSGVVRLSHTPIVKILSIQARCDSYAFSETIGPIDWVDIDEADVYRSGGVLRLPPTLFGDPYTEVRVSYISGLTELPEEVVGVLNELTDLIDSGKVTEWSGINALSEGSKAIVAKYRGGA